MIHSTIHFLLARTPFISTQLRKRTRARAMPPVYARKIKKKMNRATERKTSLVLHATTKIRCWKTLLKQLDLIELSQTYRIPRISTIKKDLSPKEGFIQDIKISTKKRDLLFQAEISIHCNLIINYRVRMLRKQQHLNTFHIRNSMIPMIIPKLHSILELPTKLRTLKVQRHRNADYSKMACAIQRIWLM